MTHANEQAELQGELREVEEALERLRDEDVTPPDGPQDDADRASALTAAEEQAALIENLESRRARLMRRLGME